MKLTAGLLPALAPVPGTDTETDTDTGILQKNGKTAL